MSDGTWYSDWDGGYDFEGTSKYKRSTRLYFEVPCPDGRWRLATLTSGTLIDVYFTEEQMKFIIAKLNEALNV